MKIKYANKKADGTYDLIHNAGYYYMARVTYRDEKRKTRRKYFNTKKEANEFVERLNSDKARGSALSQTLSEQELNDAARIIEVCKTNNWNPFTVLDYYRARVEKDITGNDLSEVVEYICEVRSKDARSAKHLKQFQATARDFVRYVNKDSLAEKLTVDVITTKHVYDYLEDEAQNNGNGWSNATKNLRRAHLCTMFEQLIMHEKANHNPVAFKNGRGIKKYQKDSRTVEYMDVKMIQQCMNIISCMTPRTAAIYVMVFWCGLRIAEASRMSWDWISLEQGKLKVPQEISKVNQKRVVDIPDNAIEWLRILRSEVGQLNLVKREKSLADMTKKEIIAWKDETTAEISKMQKNARRLLKTHNLQMPKNALRHSYGTFHLALYKNIGQTATNMGNSPEIIRNHYDGECMDKNAPARFFSIRPA